MPHLWYLVSYIYGRSIVAIVPWLWPISHGNAKGSIGNIDFYGPKTFVDECLKAVNENLPNYDHILNKQFLDGKISLCFYYENKLTIGYHTAGLYTIPEQIARYKSEGICPYIVWRYFQSLETGLGLVSALNENPKRHKTLLITARKKMIDWLEKTRYPGDWKDWYKYP